MYKFKRWKILNKAYKQIFSISDSETPDEIEFLKQKLITGSQRFTWTSGRKCNFDGCDRNDLKPNIVKGWFWPPTGVKIQPNEAETGPTGPWSKTGGDGQPQPDNRELRLTVIVK